LVIKNLPITPIATDPEAIKVILDTFETDGPQTELREQIIFSEVPLEQDTDKTIGALKFDAPHSFMRMLLEDVHEVVLLADEEMRPFALAAKVPKYEPETEMMAAPEAEKKS
jgi:hypothetical protein